MLILKGKLLGVRQLDARGDFPPSCLVTVLDGSETLNLITPTDTFAQLGQLDQLAEVALRPTWRKVDLRQLGGSGRGNAYRLQVAGIADRKEAT